MIYPKRIDLNGKIGVTAPSAGLEEERDLRKLESAIENMKSLGFMVEETPNVRKQIGLVSSSGEVRAKEFMELWEREDIKYIILARGGEFLMEMLPYLDSQRIKSAEPKWVQGFSDCSKLLLYLTTNFDIATIHAANFSTYGMKPLHFSLLTSIQFVQEPEEELRQTNFDYYERIRLSREPGMELEPYNLTEKVVYKNLYQSSEEVIEGCLLGGCIDALVDLIGTPYDHVKEFCARHPEGILWYLENCEMSILDLYRALWHMKMAGWFENAKGFLIGRTSACEPVDNMTYENVLHKVFDEMNVKVIYDVDFGHVSPQWTMVNGAKATFEYYSGNGKIKSILK